MFSNFLLVYTLSIFSIICLFITFISYDFIKQKESIQNFKLKKEPNYVIFDLGMINQKDVYF
jgi:hypothetical protein